MYCLKPVHLNLIIVRFYKTDKVRVRFAPSPTGFLHLGGLRTALYNFLFAKSKNGKFILRIEDTDQTRVVQGAAASLENDLKWAGIQIDEGPNDGGNHGPYIQSARLPLYNEQVGKLLETGAAYKCFCSETRLDLLRREAVRNRQLPKYDNKCRELSKEQSRLRVEKGDTFCIRFKLSSDVVSFNDLIYGTINYNVAKQEGDPIIVKSDGYPTYHFANIVDDHFMDITHVLRGLEWQISTTKHLQMYKAFGWNPPQYGHLPLLMNTDGTKFSKRQSDLQLSHYRENGIFPLALINFVVNAGGGFEKDLQQNVKLKIHTIDELAGQFDLSRLNTHSGRLMPEKLLLFNQLELERCLKIENKEQELIETTRRLLKKHFQNLSETAILQIDDNHIRSVLHWSVHRIKKLSDLISKDFSFIWTMPKTYKVDNTMLKIIEHLNVELERHEDFSRDNISMFLRKFSEENNVKFVVLMKTLRSVISGLSEGPSVAEMMEILGKNTTIHRIRCAYINK